MAGRPGHARSPPSCWNDAGYRALASSLHGAQHGAPETRDGIYQTARTAAKACTTRRSWPGSPRPGTQRLAAFDPLRFAATRDVLYLITESKSAASPLIAGLTDAAMRAGRRRAEQAGGRLDPPMVLVLDEAANICRIADLPDLYSHLGGRGMIPVTILQSYEQGITVWGEQGMAALWGSSTKKLIGAGVHSPRLTRDVAVLIGHHDVPVRSVSVGDGRASEQISWQRRLILEAADIAGHRTGHRAAAGQRHPARPGRPAALERPAGRRADRRSPAARRGRHPARSPGRHPRWPARLRRRGAPCREGLMTAHLAPAADPP